jgi:CheY-like chemotaxis protein
VILVIALAVILLVALPVAFLIVLNRAPRLARALLMVSTDDVARKLVGAAARRVGYQVIHVYRHEDGLDKLRQNTDLRMIIIDDSVPQYEAGLMISMLKSMPIGVRPLILIVDSAELGMTAPSYRAEAVVSRPLSEKALEDAIRKVHERLDLLG